MRVIVLAAGQGFHIDGLNKCLIRDPLDGRRIIDKIIRAFPTYPITMVVGYQAVTLMQDYPQLNYIINQDWGMTNNSYSLGLALTDEPCYVLSSDLIFEPELILSMDQAADNVILTERRENRILTAINCVLEGERVVETYQGVLRDTRHPEAVGIFKISDGALLRAWKKNCLQYRNLFIGQNLPLNPDEVSVLSFDKGDHRFFEVNTPFDYLRLLETVRSVPA
jgi:choline kinase